MKKTARWACLTLALVACAALPSPAEAILLCQTDCNCGSSCSMRCWDGFWTTCGECGYPCVGSCFAPGAPVDVSRVPIALGGLEEPAAISASSRMCAADTMPAGACAAPIAPVR